MGLKSKNLHKQSYRKLLQTSLDTGVPFTDKEFKAGDPGLFYNRGFLNEIKCGQCPIKWKRPTELVDHPQFLYREKLGPNIQLENPVGIGPNDFMLAAASTVAQDKVMIYRIIPKDQQYQLHGIYKVFLWNWNVWFKVVIDDKLPSSDEKLIFSSSRCGSVFWVSFLEKALAKLYCSYEAFSKNADLTSTLTHMTGCPVERVLLTTEQDNYKDVFRLIADELEGHSLLCLLTKDSPSITDLKGNSFYLVSSVKKPTLNHSSFRKKVNTSTPAMIRLMPTKWFPEDLKVANPKGREVWLKVEDFSNCLDSLYICYLGKGFMASFGSLESQFMFDINSDNEEVIVEMTQQKLHGRDDVGYSLYKVEGNRDHRLHLFDNPLFQMVKTKDRTRMKRMFLKYGRYFLVPESSRETNFMIRVNNKTLREINQDFVSKEGPLSLFFHKAPQFVTRVVLNEIKHLEKTDKLRSLNPYCILTVGNQKTKTRIVSNTQNPDFDYFGSVFHHEKLKPLIVEVFSRGLVRDTYLGKLSYDLTLSNDDSDGNIILDLSDKGGNKIGDVKLNIRTYDDLTKI